MHTLQPQNTNFNKIHTHREQTMSQQQQQQYHPEADVIRRVQHHTILNESQPIQHILNECYQTGRYANLSPLFKQCLHMSHELIQGNYLTTLQQVLLRMEDKEDDKMVEECRLISQLDSSLLLSLNTSQYEQLSQIINQFLTSSEVDAAVAIERSWFIMLCGALCLNVFVQSNWTGPAIENLPPTLFNNVTETEKQIQQDAIQTLSIEGELAYGKSIAPHYLVLAKLFLERPLAQKHVKTLHTFNWWALRVATVHQSILSHQVQILKDMCYEYCETLAPQFAASDIKDGELAARFLLEQGLMSHTYYRTREAKEAFDSAKKATKLFMRMTGTLGVRTKYQTTKIAQLNLIAKSRNVPDVSVDEKDDLLPEEVQLEEDSDLLPTIALDSNDSDSEDDENMEEKGVDSLRVIDQSIILCLCIDVKNNNPKDGLTTEEMFPYVNKVHEEPKNWMVYSTCLLLKSRLESERSRTAERSVLQLQVLADQFKDLEPSVGVRMNYLYNLPFPPLFELNRELGDRFLSLGAAMSALQVFEKLDMWDDIIKCYIIMDKENRARRLTLERIRDEPTNPLLWCILGDLKQNEKNRKEMKLGEEYKEFDFEEVAEFYRKSWEVSQCRFSRAKRSEGNYLVKQEKFAEAVQPFELSLALSPLYPATWFTLGCCCMKSNNFERALVAFTKCIQIEPDDGESWSNLSSCHIKLGNKEKAYSALQVALKHKYESWRIWENYLVLSIDLREYQNACLAIDRLVDLKLDKNVDVQVLVLIIKAYYQIARNNAVFAEPLRDRIFQTLEKVSSKISMNPAVWNAYSLFYEVSALLTADSTQPDEQKKHVEDMQRVVEMNEKHLRSLQVAGWDKELGKFQAVCDGASRLVSSQLRTADAIKTLPDTVEINDPYCSVQHYLSQALLCLKPILSRVTSEEQLKTSESFAKLVDTLAGVEQEIRSNQ